MRRIIEGVTYRPKTTKKVTGNGVIFYPIIDFTGPKVSDSYYLNDPQASRSRARTVAIKYIKNL
jgi:hypothetical protein